MAGKRSLNRETKRRAVQPEDEPVHQISSDDAIFDWHADNRDVDERDTLESNTLRSVHEPIFGSTASAGDEQNGDGLKLQYRGDFFRDTCQVRPGIDQRFQSLFQCVVLDP